MKKLLALALGLSLVLCALPVLGEVMPFESLNATIDMPQGMQLLEGDALAPELVEATGAFAAILDEANQAYVLFTYTQDEEITAVDLTALTPEQVGELAAQAMMPYEVKEALVVEIGGEALLAITYLDESQAEQNIMVQFGDGGFVAISLRMVDNSQMTEEVGKGLLTVVTTLAFAQE